MNEINKTLYDPDPLLWNLAKAREHIGIALGILTPTADADDMRRKLRVAWHEIITTEEKANEREAGDDKDYH